MATWWLPNICLKLPDNCITIQKHVNSKISEWQLLTFCSKLPTIQENYWCMRLLAAAHSLKMNQTNRNTENGIDSCWGQRIAITSSNLEGTSWQPLEVVRQSSDSHAVVWCGSCHKVIQQLSGIRPKMVRSHNSNTVEKQSTGICMAVILQLSNCHFVSFVIDCAAYGTERLFSLVQKIMVHKS